MILSLIQIKTHPEHQGILEFLIQQVKFGLGHKCLIIVPFKKISFNLCYWVNNLSDFNKIIDSPICYKKNKKLGETHCK